MPISNASLENETCADISDWTDQDAGGGESIQVAFDGQSTFKFDAKTGYALRSKDVGSIEGLGNRIVFSVKLYHDLIGTFENQDRFTISLARSDWTAYIRYCSDGLFLFGDPNWTEIGTNIVSLDTWQSWTFDIDLSGGVGSAICDVYLDNILQDSGIALTQTGSYTDGMIYLQQEGVTSNDLITYMDYLKIGDNFTNAQINVGDAWKIISDVQINIGDTWKTVTGIQINIGDVWKTIF